MGSSRVAVTERVLPRPIQWATIQPPPLLELDLSTVSQTQSQRKRTAATYEISYNIII